MHEVPWYANIRRQTSDTPMGRILWTTIERRFQHCLNLGIVMAARLTTAWRIRQSVESLQGKSTTPLGHRLLTGVVTFGDLFTAIAACAIQHNAGTKMQTRGRITTPAPAFEFGFFVVAQYNSSC